MYKIKPLTNVDKEINIPPDKSISHRAVIISSLCKEKTVIKPFSRGEDTLTTLDCVKKLGVKAAFNKDGSLVVQGAGIYFPKRRKVILKANESGTTMRILTGLLCAQKFSIEFKAAPSLNKRPMGRIIWPLEQMNARFYNKREKAVAGGRRDVYPPLHIKPTDRIKGGDFNLPIASAQVKSAVMFASLYADSQTVIQEPYQSRDHTERMLSLFKANVKIKGKKIICDSTPRLISPKRLFIPSDFSSAAFFIVLGLILKNTKLIIRDVNINPTRSRLLKVLKRMGGQIKVVNKKSGYEPYADIMVKSSDLSAAVVTPEEVPAMIDEIPVLCVAASFAKGRTVILGVKELKVKETDRIKSMVTNLKKAGVNIESSSCLSVNRSHPGEEGIMIEGAKNFKGAKFKSFSDHRTAMSMIVLGAATRKQCLIDDIKCVNKSFPEFIRLFESLHKNYTSIE